MDVVESGGVVYDAAASAWNSHVGRNDSIDWMALAALIAGGLLALLVLFVGVFLHHAWSQCSERVACQLQWPILIHYAPQSLPIIRTTNKPGQKKGPRAQQARATPKQWNAMRMQVGPQVPDKAIEELLGN